MRIGRSFKAPMLMILLSATLCACGSRTPPPPMVVVVVDVRGAHVEFSRVEFVDEGEAAFAEIAASGVCGGERVEQKFRVELTAEQVSNIRAGQRLVAGRSVASAQSDPDAIQESIDNASAAAAAGMAVWPSHGVAPTPTGW